MTSRETRTPGSLRAEGTSQTDARSSPPPGNLDPALGPVDNDELEMQSFRRVLRELAEELGPKK